jgi:hypothetical protein
VGDTKLVFFRENPEYKVFENQIGSYLTRAVSLRNESGVLSPEDYLEYLIIREAYFWELCHIAEKEIKACIRRFKHQLPECSKKELKQEESKDKYFDDYIAGLKLI